VIVDVKVPVFAESVTEGTLLDWKKNPGESVAQDELLVEIETDKVVLEVSAPQSGLLKEVIKQSGETVQSGELLARVDTESAAEEGVTKRFAAEGQQASPSEEDAAEEQPAPPSQAPTAAPQPSQAEEAEETEQPGLSPAVRKLVAEHELDPTRIAGTGKGGRITKGDVLNYLEEQDRGRPSELAATPAAPEQAPPSEQPPDRGQRRVPMSRIRARIAERLVEAQRTAAILTTFNEVNMQPVTELRNRHRERLEKEHGIRLGFMSFFAKAAVLALKKFPAVNASIEGSDIVYHDYYDLGIAIGSPRGLVVPVVRDIDRRSFAEVEQQIAEFGRKAKEAQLSIGELSGGTFTITNGGVFGSLLSTPILNPPQSAILGMHKVEQRPVVENGEIVIRPMMYLALSYDHRLIDGREAVQFLVTLKEALEEPERLLLGA
jgi:2-oxoglutarate dehydrogenase E2 component (dihydrolipoamide succinyltransferase)